MTTDRNAANPAEIKMISNCTYCALPLKMETYSNCDHGCIYCATKAFQHQSAHQRALFVGKTPEKLIKQLSGEVVNELTPLIKARIPIQWGVVEDPFPERERFYRNSLGVLKVLRHFKYPFMISTKGLTIQEEPYYSLFKDCREHCAVRVSMPFHDDEQAARIEKHSPPPSERLKMAEFIAKDGGLYVMPRLQPYVPGNSYPSKKWLEKVAGFTTRFTVESIVMDKMSTPTRWDPLFQALGYKDAMDYLKFKLDAKEPFQGAYYNFNNALMLEEWTRLHADAKKVGLKVGFIPPPSMDARLVMPLNEGDYCCQINPSFGYFKDAYYPMYTSGRLKEMKFEKHIDMLPDQRKEILLGFLKGSNSPDQDIRQKRPHLSHVK